MSSAFLGEIRSFGFNYAPQNWAQCAGQLIPISQNTALFSILGTYFGGNGVSNFALPDLRDRVAVGAGTPPGGATYDLGEMGGEASVTVLLNQYPSHVHALQAAGARFQGDKNTPGPTVAFAPANGCTPYFPNANPTIVQMAPLALSISGGNPSPSPHNNMAPTTAIGYCICINGIFPPRS